MKSEQLLKELIKEGKSELLDFKEVIHKESIAKILCGFLNGNGGRIIIGVADNSEIIGVEDAEQQVLRLGQYLVNVIVPDAAISITLENLGKKELIVLKVWKGSKQPYIFDGSIYYRKKRTTQKASSNEISALIHGRQIAEQHWERRLAFGVTLEDLEKSLIIATLNESRKNYRGNFESDDVLDFLNHYGLYVNGSFTNACVILFAKKPSKFIPQIRVRLTEYAEAKTDDYLIRDVIFEGNLFRIRNDLEKYVNGLGVRSVFDKKRWKRIDFTFPPKALQEGIINALMHRDYSSYSSGIAISVYPDKLIIANTGKLPDDIKIKDLKQNHLSHPVNPDITHIVFLRGLIDKLGRGTLKIIADCNDAGLKIPMWKQTSSEVVLTFYGPKALAEKKTNYDTASDAVIDTASDAVIDVISDAVIDAVNRAISDAVIKRLIQEIVLLWTSEGKNLKDLMHQFQVSRATLQRDMTLLKTHQFVQFVGASKTGVYKLTPEFSKKLNVV